MKSVSVRYAKAHLAQLIEQALRGKPFLIAKSGIPVVKVASVDATRTTQRLGFLDEEICVPEDFDRMGALAIATQFETNAISSRNSRSR